MNNDTCPHGGPNPLKRIRTWNVGAIALLVLASLATPLAAAAPAVIVVQPNQPSPDYRGQSGYVWNEPPGHTHVALGVSDPTHTVALSTLPIDTHWIDLEITGLPGNLPQGTPYTLAGVDTYGLNQTFKVPAAMGSAVYWSVPAIATTLTLSDAAGNAVAPVKLAGQVACSDPRSCLAALIMQPSSHKGVATNTTRAPQNATGHSPPQPASPPPSSPRGGGATASSSGPSGYTWCANENNYCSFSGTHTVAYGAGSYWNYKSVANGINCDNADFGDPDYGVAKACYYDSPPPPSAGPPSGYTWCASENSACSFSGTMQVAYGANGYYTYKTFTNGVYCDNNHFGDPVPGTVKACYTAGTPSGGSRSYSDYGPSSTTWCADEGSTCYFSGTRDVAYGYDGYYNYQTNVQGSIGCGNSAFGDPYTGHAKSCYYSNNYSTGSSGSPSSPPAQTGGSGGSSSGGGSPPAQTDTGGGTHGPRGGGDASSSYGPSGSTYCARENDWCSVSGTQTVAYGASGSYKYKTVSGGIQCDNADFGDPVPYTVKDCYVMTNSDPTGYDSTTGFTLVQAAVATTPDASVTTSGCFGHQVAIHAEASGGIAFHASVGGDYTYSQNSCTTVTSNGVGEQLQVQDGYERATFSDGSTKVYGNSHAYNPPIYVNAWNIQFVCGDGTKNCFQGYVLAPGRNVGGTMQESGSLSATFGSGWSAAAWSASGSLTLQNSGSSQIDWSIKNSGTSSQTYYVGALGGTPFPSGGTPTGLVGFVET
jgi:hypothetical protein